MDKKQLGLSIQIIATILGFTLFILASTIDMRFAIGIPPLMLGWLIIYETFFYEPL